MHASALHQDAEAGDSKSEPGPGYTVGMCWYEKGTEINKTEALKRKARLAGGIAQW